MSILLKKIIWFSVDNIDNGTNITDSLDTNLNRGLEVRNNTLTLNLKNPIVSLNTDGTTKHEYITEEGQLMFQEKDMFKVYVRYTDDMADVENSVWGSNIEEPSVSYLKGTYYLIDVGTEHTINSTKIKLTCADKTYIIFNQLHVGTIQLSESLNTAQIVQKVIREKSQTTDGIYPGTGEQSGVNYDIDARLFSEAIIDSGTTDGATTTNKLIDSGQNFTSTVTVGDCVRNTTDNTLAIVSAIDDDETLTLSRDIMSTGENYQISQGHIQDTRSDGTSFPDKAISKIWKPVYEWIADLSQVEYINTETEITDKDLLYSRPFLFYVDELNKAHWFETDGILNDTLTIGTTPNIYSVKLDKKVFDTVNFIIYRGGEDFYGAGTLGYYYESSSDIKTRKMRVVAMTDIAKTLINNEIKNDHDTGSIVEDNSTPGVFTFGGNRYAVTTPITAFWNGTEYANAGAYNDALRKEIVLQCENRAKDIVSRLINARYKGTLERKGYFETTGALLKLTNTQMGQVDEQIRVMSVRDIITKVGWFTTLDLEQDQKAIETGVS